MLGKGNADQNRSLLLAPRAFLVPLPAKFSRTATPQTHTAATATMPTRTRATAPSMAKPR